MTALRHPSDAVLAAYAAGTLDRARRIVVATHLESCAICRTQAAVLEALGGAMLDGLQPTPMVGGFAALAPRLDDPRAAARRIVPAVDAELPKTLAAFEVGPWRKITGGIAWRPVLNEPGMTRLLMLRAEGGTRLPRHRHTGIEWTCILQGAYRHSVQGRFGPGDFDEADETIEHHPTVEEREPCVCLVALEGRVLLQGFVGRLSQPLIRF